MKKFARIYPLPEFYKMMGWSRATGERRRRDDPDFPPLIQIGVNRQGVHDYDGAKYQAKLQKRVGLNTPKPNAFDAERARTASRLSAERRRAKKREAEQKRRLGDEAHGR